MVNIAAVATQGSSVAALMSANRVSRPLANIDGIGEMYKPVPAVVLLRAPMSVSTTPFAVRLDTTSTAATIVLAVKLDITAKAVIGIPVRPALTARVARHLVLSALLGVTSQRPHNLLVLAVRQGLTRTPAGRPHVRTVPTQTAASVPTPPHALRLARV